MSFCSCCLHLLQDSLSGTVPSAEGCVWTAEGAVKKKRENCSGKVFSINVLLSCNSSLFACVPLL